jgi:hypothetical protein
MAWIYQEIGSSANLAIGLITFLIFLTYMLQMDINEMTKREECDDV